MCPTIAAAYRTNPGKSGLGVSRGRDSRPTRRCHAQWASAFNIDDVVTATMIPTQLLYSQVAKAFDKNILASR